MPPLTRWFVRSALIYFVVALLVGAALMARTLVDWPPIVGAMGPTYFHLLMVGWVTQLIIGIAYWMFPKLTRDRPRGQGFRQSLARACPTLTVGPRGSEPLGWAVYVLLNAGLLVRVVAEPLAAVYPHPGLGWAVAVSAVLQWLAGMGFVINTWGRVKEK